MRRFLAAAIALGCVLAGSGAEARSFTSQVTEMEHIPRIRPEFKVPDDPDMLFYVERSPNANTVVYAVNRDAKGDLDLRDPVQAFWRWFNVDGHKKPLNFIERLLAYGVQAARAKPGQPINFTIAALPERVLTLDMEDKKHPVALIQIGGRAVRLDYVYLEVVEGGLMPQVPSLDIFGTDQASGKAVHEHLIQN